MDILNGYIQMDMDISIIFKFHIVILSLLSWILLFQIQNFHLLLKILSLYIYRYSLFGEAFKKKLSLNSLDMVSVSPFKMLKINDLWASLVVQWLTIRLPMQGTRVRSLVQEDPTCCGATKPTCHNYWACALEPVSHNFWACVPQLLKPARLEPMLRNKRSHRNEKPSHHNEE